MGDTHAYPDAGHLAAAAGLAPVPNDSGRRVGNLHRLGRPPSRTAFRQAFSQTLVIKKMIAASALITTTIKTRG